MVVLIIMCAEYKVQPGTASVDVAMNEFRFETIIENISSHTHKHTLTHKKMCLKEVVNIYCYNVFIHTCATGCYIQA